MYKLEDSTTERLTRVIHTSLLQICLFLDKFPYTARMYHIHKMSRNGACTLCLLDIVHDRHTIFVKSLLKNWDEYWD